MRPIKFEFQKMNGITVVALDATLKDFDFKAKFKDGKMWMEKPEATIKDCRHIDGCVYFHLGIVTDSVMVDLIEKFQKLRKEKGWKPGKGIDITDMSVQI